MANNQSADAYRERRKKQIARAAKKNAKRSPGTSKIGKRVFTAVCILIAVAVVLYSVWTVAYNALGIPQRVITVAEVDGVKVSAAEYNYYYMALFNQIYYYSQYYEQQYSSSYGAGMGASLTGYDTSLAPTAQAYTAEDEYGELGEDPTWDDYFRANAARRCALVEKSYDAAIADGYKLTDDEIKEIDDSIEEFRKKADENDFSLSRYIALTIGDGVNEALYRELMERDTLSTRYNEDVSEKYGDDISDEDIEAYYLEHTEEFDSASFYMFPIKYVEEADEDETTTEAASGEVETTPEEGYSAAEAEARANSMLAKVDGEDSFEDLAYQYAEEDEKETYEDGSAVLAQNITKSDIKSNLPDVAEWLFDSSRAVGDKAVIHNESNLSYYVIRMVSLPARNNELPVDVRHILIKFATTDADGNTIELTDEIKKTAYDTLDAIYTDWKAGEKTEDSFAKLAEEKSEDTGSKTNGGLYEGVVRGQMVPQFEDWCYDTARVAGDTEIIETTYGYHLMYYVGRQDEPSWSSEIRSTLGTEDYTEYVDAQYAELVEKETKNEKMFNFFANKLSDRLDRNYNAS